MRHIGAVRRLVSRGHRVATFEERRVCAEEGCATRLSIYNPDAFCALHAARARSFSTPGR
jgi:hypothetical protein